DNIGQLHADGFLDTAELHELRRFAQEAYDAGIPFKTAVDIPPRTVRLKEHGHTWTLGYPWRCGYPWTVSEKSRKKRVTVGGKTVWRISCPDDSRRPASRDLPVFDFGKIDQREKGGGAVSLREGAIMTGHPEDRQKGSHAKPDTPADW